MKKILAILAILAFSRAQASQPVIYGIGAEGSFVQSGVNKCKTEIVLRDHGRSTL